MIAAGGTCTPLAARALEELCRTYWYPLYAYIRRQGRPCHDAQDLTQAFFARLLEKNSLQNVSPQKGRFRSYLLTALNHFLVDDWKKANRQIRGGGSQLLSFDEAAAEHRYELEPVEQLTAERIYERRWALTLLEQVLALLEQEFVDLGNAALFAELQIFLLGEKNAPAYAVIAAKLGLTEGAVKAAVYRLRRRYRELLRQTIAQTVADPDEIDEELRHLFAVLVN